MIHTLRPGQPVPRLRDGDQLHLTEGTFTAPIRLSGLVGVVIRGQGEKSILDGMTAAAGASGIRLQDCRNTIIEDLCLAHWRKKGSDGGHGIFATDCEGLAVSRVAAVENAGSGILTGNCSGVRIEGCDCSRNLTHGVYLSGGGDDLQVTGCTLDACGRCGLQINARPKRSRNVLVKACRARRNLNAALQFAAVTAAIVAGNELEGNRQGVVLWNDNGGRKFACHDFDLTRQEGEVSVTKDCTNIRRAL